MRESAELHTGDIVRVDRFHFRVEVAGEAPSGSLAQAAWTLVEHLACGTLRVTGGVRGALRLVLHASDARTLEALERSPLAFEAERLEVYVEGHQVRSSGKRWAGAVGALAGRVHFVVAHEMPWMPEPRQRFPPVRLLLDGMPVPLEQPVFLHGHAGRLRGSHEWAPVPRLLRRGSATELDCSFGTGALLQLARPESPLAVEVRPGLTRALLPGDAWHLVTASATQVLRAVLDASSTSSVEPVRNGGWSYEGVSLSRFVCQSEDDLEVFTELEPGRFFGDAGHEFFVGAHGRLLAREPDGAVERAMYEPHAGGLLLPASSDFLAGHRTLPSGPLTSEALQVFVDSLHESGDGAALALQRFLDAKTTAERGAWFVRLIRSARTRPLLSSWARSAFHPGALLPSELTAVDLPTAHGFLEAIADEEPLFTHVDRVLIPEEHGVFREALVRITGLRRVELRIDVRTNAGGVKRLWPDHLERINPQWPAR